MPLTSKGREIMASMRKQYSSEKKAKSVFYASKNAGRITGVDQEMKNGAEIWTGKKEGSAGYDSVRRSKVWDRIRPALKAWRDQMESGATMPSSGTSGTPPSLSGLDKRHFTLGRLRDAVRKTRDSGKK